MSGTLELFSHMLKNSESVKPWSVKELSAECGMPESTVYNNLRMLKKYRLVRHVSGGYVLGEEVLVAGAKYQAKLSSLMDISAYDKLQEALYG